MRTITREDVQAHFRDNTLISRFYQLIDSLRSTIARGNLQYADQYEKEIDRIEYGVSSEIDKVISFETNRQQMRNYRQEPPDLRELEETIQDSKRELDEVAGYVNSGQPIYVPKLNRRQMKGYVPANFVGGMSPGRETGSMKQGGHCARTGEKHCKCLRPKPQISPLQVDLKSVVRKLFTDHGVYTVFVIKSVVDGGGDADAVLVPRLMQNQKEIGDAVKPIVGEDNGNRVTAALSQHIALAGKTIKAAKNNDPNLQAIIAEILAQGDDVAEVLSGLNPEKLPYADVQKMFQQHNQFVIDMTVARLQKRFADEQRLYDAYYAELLEMSDAIVAAL